MHILTEATACLRQHREHARPLYRRSMHMLAINDFRQGCSGGKMYKGWLEGGSSDECEVDRIGTRQNIPALLLHAHQTVVGRLCSSCPFSCIAYSECIRRDIRDHRFLSTVNTLLPRLRWDPHCGYCPAPSIHGLFLPLLYLRRRLMDA